MIQSIVKETASVNYIIDSVESRVSCKVAGFDHVAVKKKHKSRNLT